MQNAQEKTIGLFRFTGDFVDRMAFLGNIQRHLKASFPEANPIAINAAVALGEKIQKHWFEDAKECERLAKEVATLCAPAFEIELKTNSN